MNYFFVIVICFFTSYQSFRWVSFELEQRSNRDGKTTTVNAIVYFKENSDLVIHQTFPFPLFMLNNRDGELKIYNPRENSVFQTMNYNLNSENNQFYFFLMSKTSDMGLGQLGFDLLESKLEDGLLVSLYDTSPQVKKYFDKVELVHKGKKPIFIGYLNKKGAYLKKVFYYDYQKVSDLDFPMNITEINYIETGDSIISKTTFSNFKVDERIDQQILNFRIPQDARLIE